MMNAERYTLIGLTVLVSATVFAACGGSSGDGTGAGTGTVAVSGTVVEADAGAAALTERTPAGTGFRIRAIAAGGSVHETDANDRGRFTLMLPPGDSYVMGFEHRDTAGMHFGGYMAFGCGVAESDHFFVSGRERAIDLGTITVRRDGRFARPERNPLEQLDRDGDGLADARDPDARCADVGDRNHDGFYDDDMDHDGHHDDDFDRDGHHDFEVCGMGHDDEIEDCPGPEMKPGLRT